jgi:5-(carboxyamino)imidazole ribonucleotide mutase
MAVSVGIIMGSQSDWPTMKAAAEILDELGVAYETKIVSAHRTPDRLWDYGKTAVARGLKVIIAGAGGAAHLPGMMASKTYPVATMAIGGAANAGLMAAAILAISDDGVAAKLDAWRDALSASIPEEPKDD